MNLRVDLSHWTLPSSIYIKTCQITSEITINNSIDIDHWKNSKLKFLKKPVNFIIINCRQTNEYLFHEK